MKITFKLVPHSVLPGQQVIEVRLDDAVVATITAPVDAPNALRIVSAHIATVTHNDGRHHPLPIPDLTVRFEPRRYVVHGDQVVRVTEAELAAKKIELETA